MEDGEAGDAFVPHVSCDVAVIIPPMSALVTVSAEAEIH